MKKQEKFESTLDNPPGQIVGIPISGTTLEGDLNIPKNARGIVLFAHGSGSSRLSPRNQRVAKSLQQSGLATLLIDLLTSQEESIDSVTGELRFNVEFLAHRLVGATDWLLQYPATKNLSIGYFGASTGAAAALMAAVERPKTAAIVSRGGRADLAASALTQVKAPTLLIIGGDDLPVIELNWEAFTQLQCEKRLEIVSGASHLFEEPGTLDEVARLARNWFETWLDPSLRTLEAA